MNKKELRIRAKQILCETDKSVLKKESSVIADKVIESDEFRKSRVLFIYVSTENEPATDRIIEMALSLGKTVCVPKCISESEMTAVKISSMNELKAGKFGIREPENTNGEIEKNLIDTAVIPCVAASYSGKRLGHGAGYYDRFLAGTYIYKICLCFGRLVSDDIPTDKHDIRVDKIISEEN